MFDNNMYASLFQQEHTNANQECNNVTCCQSANRYTLSAYGRTPYGAPTCPPQRLARLAESTLSTCLLCNLHIQIWQQVNILPCLSSEMRMIFLIPGRKKKPYLALHLPTTLHPRRVQVFNVTSPLLFSPLLFSYFEFQASFLFCF